MVVCRLDSYHASIGSADHIVFDSVGRAHCTFPNLIGQADYMMPDGWLGCILPRLMVG